MLIVIHCATARLYLMPTPCVITPAACMLYFGVELFFIAIVTIILVNFKYISVGGVKGSQCQGWAVDWAPTDLKKVQRMAM